MAKIELGEKYETRDGRDATVFHIMAENGSSDYTVFGMMHATEIGDVWIPAMWTADGKFDAEDDEFERGKNDLVSIYETFLIDAPVRAWNTVEDTVHAHFAGVDEDGLPMVWADGRTSHSSRDNLNRQVSYSYAVKY